ncbi:MAG: chemotaxis protein CheY [Verrucomicrobia bacterium]|nr:chemotaxis protein CheY [Verrucomicrobiota bacterium]
MSAGSENYHSIEPGSNLLERTGSTPSVFGATARAASPLVIMVDDNPWIRESIPLMLGAHGYNCRCYATPEAYLDSSDFTDCLVLDVNFGGMSGLELQAYLREGGANFPILFFTGDLNPETESKARAGGANAFIGKGSPAMDLIGAIERSLASKALARSA